MSALLPHIEIDRDFIGELLRGQRCLTAVEQFSRTPTTFPAQERYYSELMPVSLPSESQQFAFEVNLDSCSGCKACVVACHTLNGLDENETWRSVGTLVGDNLIQHVTTACHHCEDPGCLNGCPVKAYVKDEVTGIVRHLDDQCIGCKYCTMMCPYEVPKYSERLGIVRKCDMCHQRLSNSEAPACVQACPNEAIRIQIVDRSVALQSRLAPGAPDSSMTRPTTVYVSNRASQLKGSVPQNAGVDSLADNHWPLAVMLIATQAAIGLLLVDQLVSIVALVWGLSLPESITQVSATFALFVAGLGMNVAPLHLGQPLKAWRVFLGLKTSWLSREAVILGVFMALLSSVVAMMWLPIIQVWAPQGMELLVPQWLPISLLWVTVLVGIVGFYSSSMIYVATGRELWRYSRTMSRFGGSAAYLGLVSFAFALALSNTSFSVVCILAVIVLVTKVAYETATHYAVDINVRNLANVDARSARLALGPLRPWVVTRLALAVAAMMLLIVSAWSGVSTVSGVVLGLTFALSLAGELCERILYFSSVVFPSMPGTLR